MKRQIATVLTAAALMVSSAFCEEDEGYTLTHVSRGNVFNLGPTGLWGYGSTAKSKNGTLNFFVVDRAEVGSPAHGLVMENDMITGVNGKPFADGVDPRFAFAFAIEDSEAKDGALLLDIKRGGMPIKVTLKLEQIPAYSPTWPFNCERTDTMLQNACEYLRQEQMPEGDIVADDGNIGPTQAGLLWLAVGEPRYLQNAICAAYWYKEQCEAGKAGWCWTWGYGGLLMAEYYNMTGDKNILPGLENIGRIIARGQMPSGGWSHGGYSGFGAGYGEVNCAGMIDYMALLEAREIGVKVDEEAVRKAERYFDKFEPTLGNAYGNHGVKFQKLGYSSMNGKIGGMAVAWRLDDQPKYSALYSLKASRSIYGIEEGHTGHFFNMMWTPIAASLAPAEEYRGAMDQLGWYFTLSRHWRGGLYCQPHGSKGRKYSNEGGVNMTTGGYGMVLAIPRRHLRILGAPKSVFAQTLPAELEAAKKLHQSNQWEAAIKAVDAYIEKGGHDKETVRMANELRDKSKYVKAGIEEAYIKLEELASGSERGARMGSRPFKASGIIRHLRNVVGEDDARIKAIEATFPERFRGIWRHGENYHQAFRTLRSLNTMPWFIFASLLRQTVPDFAMPADYPAWQAIAEIPADGGGCKATYISPGQEEPEGWTELGFDDTAWKGLEKEEQGARRGRGKKVKIPEGSTYLVRVPFEMKNPNVKQLRVLAPYRTPAIQPGGKMYINGVCVVETFTGINFREKVTLLDNARHLLRKGKNVFAYSSTGEMPRAVLDADAINSKSLEWTADPDRDAGIRNLVAQRRTPEPYYQADKDKRTPKELMDAFTAEPFFMPEAYYALQRFEAVLPDVEDRTSYVESLLKSSNWGARWTGVIIVCQAMESVSTRGMSGEEKADAEAKMAADGKWAKQFVPQIVELLNDPNRQVRREAGIAAGLMGGDAKAGIPDLIKLVEDVEGQNWYVRKAAFEALGNMPVEETVKQAFMRVALKDPSSPMRGSVLGTTFRAKDPATVENAVQTYKSELIDQVFDAPHGMFTRSVRSQMAKKILENLTKDEIRPHLPRFFESLNRPTGHQLKGSIDIILSFGEEVRPKLEELAQSDDLILRYNAIDALRQMTTGDKLTPKRLEFFKRQVEPLLNIDNPMKADTATKWLEALKAGGWTSESAAMESEESPGGAPGGGGEGGKEEEE